MRLLVTGRNGQVASSLAERGGAFGIDVLRLGRPEIDLEKPDGIGPAIAALKPDLIVSAAAFTAVDRAETEPKRAFATNAVAPGIIGQVAGELGVPVIQLSTDYVFSGDKTAPYLETDEIGPQTVYGQSKLRGEQALADATPNHVILRVAWLYSPFGSNFVKTMLRLASERDAVSVVSDQFGSPTSALDIADAILAISPQILASNVSLESRGLFHLVGAGDATWAELAEAVFASSKVHGGPTASVIPIETSAYKTAAKRPKNSRLDASKFENVFGLKLPKWRSSLDVVVRRLLTTSSKN